MGQLMKIEVAVQVMYGHISPYRYDNERIKHFKKALSFVTSVKELKFLDKLTMTFDHDYEPPLRVSMWDAEIEGASEIRQLVCLHVSDLSEKLLIDITVEDAKYLLNFLNPSYVHDFQKMKIENQARKLKAKIQTQTITEKPTAFQKLENNHGIFMEKQNILISNLLLFYEENKDFEKDLFFGELEKLDIFFQNILFQDRDQYRTIADYMARYKKLLRKSIRNLNLSELESLYYQTRFNSVSSIIILNRYEILLEKMSKNFSENEFTQMKDKLLAFKNANIKT